MADIERKERQGQDAGNGRRQLQGRVVNGDVSEGIRHDERRPVPSV